jgi:hypothetical protein
LAVPRYRTRHWQEHQCPEERSLGRSNLRHLAIEPEGGRAQDSRSVRPALTIYCPSLGLVRDPSHGSAASRISSSTRKRIGEAPEMDVEPALNKSHVLNGTVSRRGCTYGRAIDVDSKCPRGLHRSLCPGEVWSGECVDSGLHRSIACHSRVRLPRRCSSGQPVNG